MFEAVKFFGREALFSRKFQKIFSIKVFSIEILPRPTVLDLFTGL